MVRRGRAAPEDEPRTMERPKQVVRKATDAALTAGGWEIQDLGKANVHAARGVAIGEFPIKTGHGLADYLLYVDGKAAGFVEAKEVGTTPTRVEVQTRKCSDGIPDHVPQAWNRLPFLYQSTGIETRFTNRLDPEPRSRQVFNFHSPEILAEWLKPAEELPAGPPLAGKPATLRARLQSFPEPATAAAVGYCGHWKAEPMLRWERMDEDFTYGAAALDRDEVAVGQIRTFVRASEESSKTW